MVSRRGPSFSKLHVLARDQQRSQCKVIVTLILYEFMVSLESYEVMVTLCITWRHWRYTQVHFGIEVPQGHDDNEEYEVMVTLKLYTSSYWHWSCTMSWRQWRMQGHGDIEVIHKFMLTLKLHKVMIRMKNAKSWWHAGLTRSWWHWGCIRS